MSCVQSQKEADLDTREREENPFLDRHWCVASIVYSALGNVLPRADHIASDALPDQTKDSET